VAALAPAEDAHHLDLVPFLEELAPLDQAVLEVVRVDRRAHAQLLQRRVRLGLAAFLLLLRVLELAEVHHPAHGRLGVGLHLDEVEPGLVGDAARFVGRDHADLLVGGVDQSNLGDADLAVDPVLVGGFVPSRRFSLQTLWLWFRDGSEAGCGDGRSARRGAEG
jgi:hypothetical protein